MHIATMLLLLASAATLTQKQTATVKKVEASLMAPCCYSQTIDRHMSDAAEQMRFEVTDMAARGSSEQEILDHYKAIYGERILAVPDGATGRLAFAIPLVVYAGACMLMALILRNFRAAAKSLDQQTILARPHADWLAIQRRIREELDDYQ
jgi:cytochrome c-type biogenesis protein CcmH/NrfF